MRKRGAERFRHRFPISLFISDKAKASAGLVLFPNSPPNYPGKVSHRHFSQPETSRYFLMISDPNQSKVLALSFLVNQREF